MVKFSYACCLSLSPDISAQFTFEMFVAVQNRKNKVIKTPYFGSSRSFKVIDVNLFEKRVPGACYDKQHVCAYL